MPTWIVQLTELLALPEYGLSTVFVVSFISATLLPMGSEPVVFGLVKLNPELFWPAVLVATAGNTLGGALDWWLGYGANKVAGKYKHSSQHNR
ncbi:MAG: DedA family protein, partial [Polaromonas sp.]|nr:DedA family protein [Polaromonas sp.]